MAGRADALCRAGIGWHNGIFMTQLLLDVGREDRAVFENFYPGENAQLVAYLRALVELGQPLSARIVFLWGSSGVGKSHLLQAVHAEVSASGKQLRMWQPGMPLDEEADWVVVDGMSAIVGNPQAQRALLTQYEAIKHKPGVMLLAAKHPPAESGLELPDLISRLSAAEMFEVRPLSDVQKREALRQRADRRGFRLSDEVLNWLLGRASRDMGDLLAVLDGVDTATLVEQRRVTVPLLKKVMAAQG